MAAKYDTISFRFDPKVKDAAKIAAIKNGQTLTQFVGDALKNHIAKFEKTSA